MRREVLLARLHRARDLALHDLRGRGLLAAPRGALQRGGAVTQQWEIRQGDALALLREMPDASVDAIVTDPPYALGFMGKSWDSSLPGVGFWTEALRVAKPGTHLVAFGGSRTYHRLACAIEDSGWEVRDCLMWLYGSGFPKSLDVSKAIDKAVGAEREVVGRKAVGKGNRRGEGFHHDGDLSGLPVTAPATDEALTWQGWGTALKPAHEPIILARKPLSGTVAANVLEHGTGALNVDGCHIGTAKAVPASAPKRGGAFPSGGWDGSTAGASGLDPNVGRWPANVLLSEEAAAVLDEQSGTLVSGKAVGGLHRRSNKTANCYGAFKGERTEGDVCFGDSGGASRFFYTAKASAGERHAMGRNTHPTVKPVALMRWLCRLVTPRGGLVLDPFMGSGSTGVAALAEGFRFLGMEREADYCAMARRRIAGPLFAEQGA